MTVNGQDINVYHRVWRLKKTNSVWDAEIFLK